MNLQVRNYKSNPITQNSELLPSGHPLVWNWIMAVHTLHGVNVIGTLPAFIRGIHYHYIQITAGDCRVTGIAGPQRIVRMVAVACQAADSFMYTGGSTIVLRPCFMGPVGGMALHADALNRIVGNKYRLSLVIDIGFPEQIGAKVHPVGAQIKGGILVPGLSLIKSAHRIIHGPWMAQACILHMNAVAGQAGDYSLLCLLRHFQAQWPGGGDGFHEIRNTPLVIHAVTPETIGIGALHGVMLFIEEDVCIGGRMTA